MSTSSIHKIRNTFLVALLVVVLGSLYLINSSLVKTPQAEAGTGQNVSGWAWSDTYGWISLNSTDCDQDKNGFVDTFCGGTNTASSPVQNYGVDVQTGNKAAGGTGDFSGNAWSPLLGWVSFDRTIAGNPPQAPFNGGVGPIAQVDWSTGKVTGWAKAKNATTWDGWIRLSDDSNVNWAGRGVAIVGDRFTGYAWGNDDATKTDGSVGWIDFAPKVNGVAIGARISAPPCVGVYGDPSITWGSCNPTVTCDGVTYIPGNPPYTNVPGVAVGVCSTTGGGTTIVSCGNNATLICPTTTPPPTGTVKTHWWQF